MIALIRKIRTARHLPQETRSVVRISLFWIPVTGALLPIIGYKRLERLISHIAERSWSVRHQLPPDQRRDSVETGFRLARKNLPYRGSCLSRSVLLQAIAKANGLEASLCVGVRKSVGCLEAHAWVRVNGEDVGCDSAVSGDFKRLSGSQEAGWVQSPITR